jgi:Protein of unknown function (DUF3795)
MVEINNNLLAPCGLYCGVCAIYIAHKNQNDKFKKLLVDVYKPFTKEIEDIQCTGCLSNDIKFAHCQECSIRNCVQKKGYEGCHECSKFPCWRIKSFPTEEARKNMLRAIPRWKKLGTEKWVEEEEARNLCQNCGKKLFRGARRCNGCKTEVKLN